MPISKVVMDKATSTASYTISAGTAAGGMLSLNEWALLIGIAFAGLTFVINWWYQKRQDIRDLEKAVKELEYKQAHDERERQFHEARMQAFVSKGPVDE